MGKEKMLWVMVVCVAALMGTQGSVLADEGAGESECRSAYDDDAMYCRFFVDEIIGDVAHVERVTGVPGYYWYSDAQWDYWIFYWCYRETGVVLRFHPDGGVLSVMKGAVGFTPGTRYSECHAK